MVRKQYALIDFDSNIESDSPLSTKPKPRAKPRHKTPEQPAESECPMKLSYAEKEIFEEEEGKPRMTRVEMRARRAIYNEIKAKVKKMEAHNTSKMIVFPAIFGRLGLKRVATRRFITLTMSRDD